MTETRSHVALQQLKADREAVLWPWRASCSVNDLDELCIKDDHLDLELQTTDRVELMDDQRFRWGDGRIRSSMQAAEKYSLNR